MEKVSSCMFGRALNTRLTKHKNARMTLTEILLVASVLTLNIFSMLTQSLTRFSFYTTWKHQKTSSKRLKYNSCNCIKKLYLSLFILTTFRSEFMIMSNIYVELLCKIFYRLKVVNSFWKRPHQRFLAGSYIHFLINIKVPEWR